MIPSTVVHILSKPQRELLLEHIDGKAPIRIEQGTSLNVLLRHGLVYIQPCSKKPRFSRVTDAGRQTIALILARMADRLVQKEQDRIDGMAVDIGDNELPALPRVNG